VPLRDMYGKHCDSRGLRGQRSPTHRGAGRELMLRGRRSRPYNQYALGCGRSPEQSAQLALVVIVPYKGTCTGRTGESTVVQLQRLSATICCAASHFFPRAPGHSVCTSTARARNLFRYIALSYRMTGRHRPIDGPDADSQRSVISRNPKFHPTFHLRISSAAVEAPRFQVYSGRNCGFIVIRDELSTNVRSPAVKSIQSMPLAASFARMRGPSNRASLSCQYCRASNGAPLVGPAGSSS
jgi:hypothetical protein